MVGMGNLYSNVGLLWLFFILVGRLGNLDVNLGVILYYPDLECVRLSFIMIYTCG